MNERTDAVINQGRKVAKMAANQKQKRMELQRARQATESCRPRSFSTFRSMTALAMMAALSVGCDKSVDSFSLLEDQASFKQSSSYAAKKIDVLWVVDNSGSMDTSQQNLANNFASFISRFNQKGLDFQMAVVTTDGWEKRFNSSSTKARFKDGLGANRTGYYVMDKNTPSLSSVFTTNIKVGVNGNGDERALDSFRYSLNDAFNIGKNFRRSDAFLAVVIVSDEEDFSHTGLSLNESYSNPNLFAVSEFKNFLDTYTGRVAGEAANYSVSSITVPDQACVNQLSTDGFTRKISTRVPALVDLTGGVKGSLCSNFGDTLDLISESIVALSSVFKLARVPVESSIVVTVDGSVVPQDANNGWTFDASINSVVFHGPAIPGANSDIRIAFDPVSIKE